MSYQAKVTSKGQITLPAEMREELGLKIGDHVEFRKSENGTYEVVTKRHTLADLRGILSVEGQTFTNDEIVEMVDEGLMMHGMEVGRRFRRET